MSKYVNQMEIQSNLYKEVIFGTPKSGLIRQVTS